jgi:class 3 adenylate cyclase
VGQEHRYRAQTDGEAEGRVLVTLLFTDLVGSTRIAATLGDRRWAMLLRAHHARVRELLAAYGGHEVDDAGDGFFVTFPVASAGVRCAADVAASLRELGLSARAGLHTGECVLEGGRVRGVAIHVAARVVCRAGRGEVLVTRTVRDVVVGSELEFEDRGSHELRGLPGLWDLYAVRDGVGRQAEDVAPAELVSHTPRLVHRRVPVLT